jgi:hypothetical protein
MAVDGTFKEVVLMDESTIDDLRQDLVAALLTHGWLTQSCDDPSIVHRGGVWDAFMNFRRNVRNLPLVDHGERSPKFADVDP